MVRLFENQFNKILNLQKDDKILEKAKKGEFLENLLDEC